MKPKPKPYLILTTAPDTKTAKHLAQTALQKHLIACANILPKTQSHYHWQNKIQHTTEHQLLLKTTQPNLKKLQQHIQKQHPYQTPEYIAIPIHAISPQYHQWLHQQTQPHKQKTQPKTKKQKKTQPKPKPNRITK